MLFNLLCVFPVRGWTKELSGWWSVWFGTFIVHLDKKTLHKFTFYCVSVCVRTYPDLLICERSVQVNFIAEVTFIPASFLGRHVLVCKVACTLINERQFAWCEFSWRKPLCPAGWKYKNVRFFCLLTLKYYWHYLAILHWTCTSVLAHTSFLYCETLPTTDF